tara:strand:- start:165 stop:755 length:591 start_codon:yes stop_codon:yes gene_type:complete
MTTETKKQPIELFLKWFDEAKSAEPALPEAMSVASVAADGRPSSRMVLLKDVDARGFTFYTNLNSRKASEIQENANVALLFHWKSLKRQVRVEGLTKPVSNEEADAYFATRDRGAQIGAWASDQSAPMSGQFELEKKVAEWTVKFGVGKIPRPPFWSGLRVEPSRIEFWSDGRFRLHERLIYIRNGDEWKTERLFP